MSIIKGTMTKKINNTVNQLYPKTSADIVLYDDNSTVYDEISNLESGKADASHTHNAATQSAAGFMSAADFKKINSREIAENTDLNDIKSEGWCLCCP